MNSFGKALQSHTPCPDGADRPGDKPERRDAAEGRGLLDRILNTPSLEQVVPRLRPDLLHRVIQACGLEDCGEIVALATPEQLARIFDLDLWRAARPGRDEQFDADRFGVWIEALAESGAAVAAQKLECLGGDRGVREPVLAEEVRGDALVDLAVVARLGKQHDVGVRVHVDEAGADDLVAAVDSAGGIVGLDLADYDDLVALDADISTEPGVAAAVKDARIAQDQVEHEGLRCELRVMS